MRPPRDLITGAFPITHILEPVGIYQAVLRPGGEWVLDAGSSILVAVYPESGFIYTKSIYILPGLICGLYLRSRQTESPARLYSRLVFCFSFPSSCMFGPNACPSWLMGLGIPGTLDILWETLGHPKNACSRGKVEMNPVSSVCFVFEASLRCVMPVSKVSRKKFVGMELFIPIVASTQYTEYRRSIWIYLRRPGVSSKPSLQEHVHVYHVPRPASILIPPSIPPNHIKILNRELDWRLLYRLETQCSELECKAKELFHLKNGVLRSQSIL